MTTVHGPEACAIIRNELNFSGHIIGVTGNTLSEDVSIFRESGASAVLVKPLTPVKFYQLLKELKMICKDGARTCYCYDQILMLILSIPQTTAVKMLPAQSCKVLKLVAL